MSSVDENAVAAAQECYFKGDFQATFDKLTHVLDSEEVSDD